LDKIPAEACTDWLKRTICHAHNVSKLVLVVPPVTRRNPLFLSDLWR
jgi:hypothetical protein